MSFRFASAGLLVFLAFVPLILSVLRGGMRAAVLAGAVTGLVGYAIVFAWLPEPLARFQDVPLVHAWIFFVVGVIYHAVQLVLFALGAAVIATRWRLDSASHNAVRNSFLLEVAMAALWVVLEWAYPKVFPWSLGCALVGYQTLRGAADIGGVYGLGVVIVFVNVALALALAAPPSSSVQRSALTAAVGMICALVTYGYWRTGAFAGDVGSDVRVHAVEMAIVQGALSTDHHYDDTRILEAWDTYERLTIHLLTRSSAGGAARPDVVIWPETTLPVYLRHNAWYRTRVEQFVNGINRPLIVGALDRAEDGVGEFNSAYAFMPAQTQRTHGADHVYHKSYLVPWAEYVPGGRLLPFFRNWRTTGEFVAGGQRDSFSLSLESHGAEPLRIAPSICFEGLQAGWFNPLVRAGASVLLNITDDGWLAGSPGPDLHLQLARMRAVETRRWLVRASNSGVSAFIDPTGEVVASLPFEKPGTLTHSVIPSDQLTPYVRFGDWVVWLSVVIVVVAFAWSFRSARERAA